VEQLLLTKHAGYLIGNQCVDFQKQDGVTEIEEAIMANTVERRLNDLLLRDEANGKLHVNRAPIYVSAVSNFTNFLDLSRKTLRSLEVGIPVLILSRSQTSQHSYRWTQLLTDLCCDAGIDPAMITFLSCTLDGIKDITSSCADVTGNLYATCSRELAADIKRSYPQTIASTGGPNTLVCLNWDQGDGVDAKTPEISSHGENKKLVLSEAIACSATIESAGQCTALRHCIVPSTVNDAECQRVFDQVVQLSDAQEAMEKSVFAGVFPDHPATTSPGTDEYKKHARTDAYVTIRTNELPGPGMKEYWRKVVVDFSKFDLQTVNPRSGRREVDEAQLDRLAAWLNENQPITLAVNGPRQEAMTLGFMLWEKTGLVVNTIGSTDDSEMPPALTCQARPQEAEVFGEFPPRAKMDKYSVFPVVVPSSNPSYDAQYSEAYLQTRGISLSSYILKSIRTLLGAIQSDAVRGYSVVLIEYLQNMSRINPKTGFGLSRTALWGVQRPPLGSKTVVHCGPDTLWDDVAPLYILFFATNARDQIELSIDPQNKSLVELSQTNKLQHTVEAEIDMNSRLRGRPDIYNTIIMTVSPSSKRFPMVGNFASLYFPLGHIKSTMPNDEEFVMKGKLSNKWINSLF
jgi:hypothetical protein